MALEELVDRYKALPMWARLTAAFVVGVAPAAYVYLDEAEVLEATAEDLANKESVARMSFERARDRKANLPKLEEQLAFTEEQLIKAKKKLPDSYRIEEILERTATIAKEAGVQLARFHPGEEREVYEPYQYVELPIATEAVGQFAQIASFLDKLAHLESSVFIKDLELARISLAGNQTSDSGKSPHQMAVAARRNVRVQSKFNLVVYRSTSAQRSTDSDASDASKPAPAENAAPEQQG